MREPPSTLVPALGCCDLAQPRATSVGEAAISSIAGVVVVPIRMHSARRVQPLAPRRRRAPPLRRRRLRPLGRRHRLRSRTRRTSV